MEADRADARRLHAIRVAEESGDTNTWIAAVLDRYMTRRQRGANEDELRADRTSILARADALRGGLRSRLGRLWAGQQLDAAFGQLLRDVLATDDPDPREVFALSEAARARMLLDSLGGNWVPPSRGLASELAFAERTVMAYGEDALDGPVWDEIRLGSELALGRSGTELQALEARYRDEGVGFGGVTPVFPIEDVQASLLPGELFLEYIIPHHPLHPAYGLWVLVVDHDGTRLVPIITDPTSGSQGFIGRITTDDHAPVDWSPLGQAIVSLRTAILEDQDDDSADAALTLLHAQLVAPLEAAGVDIAGISRLTVVPHRMLHHVPFGALLDENGVRLLERTSVSTAPSAASWSVVRRRGHQLNRHLVAFANPVFDDPELEPLPAAEREVDEVAALLSRDNVTIDVRAREDASEEAFEQHAHEAGILYLATHGAFPDAAALDLHGVVLGASDGHDGVLTANEVSRLDLGGVWTTVLSVCDGGLYRFGPGDEPLGLVPALLVAGAANVVGALWEIDDAAGRALMVRVMTSLVRDGPAEALRHAAVDMAAAGDVAVRDWAAFVVVGSGTPIR